jgi:hypothetical protein
MFKLPMRQAALPKQEEAPKQEVLPLLRLEQ